MNNLVSKILCICALAAFVGCSNVKKTGIDPLVEARELIEAGQLEEGLTFLEKAMRFGADDVVVGVVGAWYEDGSRANLGPRTYETAEDFVNDILGSEN